MLIFFFKQKTAYEMRISDWSSDVCSSDLQGDLGKSIVTKKPVLSEFFTLFPATIDLSLCAIIFAIVIGLPVGIIAGVKRGSFWDHSVMGVSLTGYSMPIFWWGLLLILLFSVNLHWTPVSGRISLLYYFDNVTGFMLIDSLLSGQKGAFASALHHLVLPAIVLGTIQLAVIARMTDRTSVMQGKSVSVRVYLGGRRIIKKKKKIQ